MQAGVGWLPPGVANARAEDILPAIRALQDGGANSLH